MQDKEPEDVSATTAATTNTVNKNNNIVNLTQILHSSPAVTNIDEWNFNVFELRSTEEKYTTVWNIISRTIFSDTFVIPEEVFANFVKEL